jgi:TrpR-related protein YerC/YecD
MRTTAQKINPSLKGQIKKTLAQAIVDLRGLEEASEFLQDFFTESECEVFSKRLAIGYWLKKKRSYSNIRENLKASSATVAVIQKMMKRPGFKLMLKKVEAEEWANQWSEKIKKFVNK